MTRCARVVLVAALLATCSSAAAVAAAAEHVDWPLRGKTMSLTIYRPAVDPKGTVVMAGGDVGWVGLAVSMSQYLAANGYIVVGINVRQYLSAFTIGASHLTPVDIERDYAALSRYLRGRQLLIGPVVVSGVSEGAGLAVLAAAAPENHDWIAGAIAMGLPASVEVAWRWSDFTSWITKRDSGEPSFKARDYLAAISPLPLVMIQSTRDEYVSAADYKELDAAARSPHRQVLIGASNHRFTDRIPELQRAFDDGLAWIISMSSPRRE
jgi:type IV secretory pathway VirJ component